MPGDTARFNFQIQAPTSTNKLSCIYSIDDIEPLIITFDKEETIVDVGGSEIVYGTVSVPADTPIGTYPGTLTVKCGALLEEGVSGSPVRQGISGPTFSVKVVRTEEERFIRGIEEVVVPGIPYSTIFVVIFVIIVLGVIYWYKKRREKK